MTYEKNYFLAAVNGDSEAFSKIFSSYQPIVFKLMKKYYIKDLEWEDWLQEGQIICYESIKNFDHDMGITFGYFYKLNFERHIFSMLRRQEAIKRKVDRDSFSLEEKIEQFGENWISSEGTIEVRSFTGLLIRENLGDFHNQLSPFETETFLRYVKGQSFTEIAGALICPVEKVKNGLDRIKAKFKKQLYK